MTDKTTKEEFEAEYARRSGMTVEKLHKMGGYANPCDCEYSGCQGWQMLFTVSISPFRIKHGELPDLIEFGKPT